MTVTLNVDAPKRGRISLGPRAANYGYPFGLWRGWASVHFPLAGIVYPAVESSAPPLPHGVGGADSQAHGASEDADLAGLRGISGETGFFDVFGYGGMLIGVVLVLRVVAAIARRRDDMSERVFERANQRYGAEGSLVHQVRTSDDLIHGGMVHQVRTSDDLLHLGWCTRYGHQMTLIRWDGAPVSRAAPGTARLPLRRQSSSRLSPASSPCSTNAHPESATSATPATSSGWSSGARRRSCWSCSSSSPRARTTVFARISVRPPP